MNKLDNGDIAIGAAGSDARKLQEYEIALKAIVSLGGQCIYGSNELLYSSYNEKEAFRSGSSKAFLQCAEIAEKALSKF